MSGWYLWREQSWFFFVGCVLAYGFALLGRGYADPWNMFTVVAVVLYACVVGGAFLLHDNLKKQVSFTQYLVLFFSFCILMGLIVTVRA